MPLIVVDIQQTDARPGRERWVAEFEAGGVVATRAGLMATSFDEIMAKVQQAHRELVLRDFGPPPAPPPIVRPIHSTLLPPDELSQTGRRLAREKRLKRAADRQARMAAQSG